ncbi:MAG TPA: hypothetical protein VFO14_01385 [Vicinamibacterales bacterium]|nr:hypothetical protein [Vicinamibacterales bacterium]
MRSPATRRWAVLLSAGSFVFAGVLSGEVVFAQAPAATQAGVPPAAGAMSDAAIEKFLREATFVKTRSAGKGVTNSVRATMTDGTLTHDVHIQTVDEQKTTGPGPRGLEVNFRDSWRYNVAAYRLDRLIGLNMVPVSVERNYRTKSAAYTWWVDDVLMDEKARLDKKIQPQSPGIWVETMQMVRVFDQLIYNVDRNMGNLLITTDWHVWAIDHTRAFRLHKTLAKPEHVARCDRGVFERLKHLDKEVLERELGEYLTGWERDAVLARRDEIVKIIEKAGEAGLFDRRQS